jgi:outer membrane protein insertion porin family
MRQTEAAWYDGQKIKLSKDRIQRLGYFKDVELDTQEVAGTQDQVDLNVNVTEKPTGMLNVGAGYSSLEHLTFMFGIQQDNIFGSGQNVGLQVNTSSLNRMYVISETDPYFTEDGVSRTVSYYHRVNRPYSTLVQGDYQLITTGASLSFGVPITELDKVYIGGGYENTELVSGLYMPDIYQTQWIDKYGPTARAYPITTGWARDSRDNYLNPSSGRYVRLNSETSFSGELRYAKIGAQYQQYFPLSKQYTFAFNSELGLGFGLNGQGLPLFKYYTSGGLGSVRGFSPGSLGERVNNSCGGLCSPPVSYVIGGSRKITINSELQMPFPGAGNDRSLRLYTFYDMGNVYGPEQSVDLSQLRTSVGLGISWVTPMGPLRLAWARPVRSFEGDTIQRVQFQIGTTF